jgi:hypothetical protein
MEWLLAIPSEVEEPKQTGKRRFGDRALHVEQKNGLRGGRPPFGLAEPTAVTHPVQAISSPAVPNEVDKVAGVVGRPVLLEVNQEVFPVAGEPVLLKVGKREREGMVDADQCGDVPVEFLAQPFSKTSARPVPARTGRRLNLFRRAGALGNVDPESLATGIGRLRARVVDA